VAITEEQIKKNWDNFRLLCTKLGDRAEAITKMLDFFEERAALCPASSRTAFHAAFPGGLVDHSLRVLSLANKISKAYEVEVPRESLIFSALFHDWGKIGSVEAEYYLPQDSDWHKEKLGEMYKINKDMQYMPNNHRSLWLMQHFGIKLSEDEFLAILLNDGPIDEGNKKYSMQEPLLAVIIHQADRMACQIEKE